jgi:hypothetical protein
MTNMSTPIYIAGNKTTCSWNNGIDGNNFTNLDCIKLTPKNLV